MMDINELEEGLSIKSDISTAGSGKNADQNRTIELLHESQITWEKFNVLGFYAEFCRFKEEFLGNLETLTTYYPPRDFTFYRVDIEKFPQLITQYQLRATPALLCIYTRNNLKEVYYGNYALIQMCALMNMLLDKS